MLMLMQYTVIARAVIHLFSIIKFHGRIRVSIDLCLCTLAIQSFQSLSILMPFPRRPNLTGVTYSVPCLDD